MIEHNGKKYARVSDILRPFSKFKGIDPDTLENKRNIGTSVHEAIADDIRGEFPSPRPSSMGYFQSYFAWKLQINPLFSQSEVRYFDDEKMITGQIDTLIQSSHPHSDLVLVDFKTSAVEGKEVWPMQAHLYKYILEQNGISINPRMLFIKLNKMGDLPQVFEYLWNSNIHAKCMIAIDSFWENEKK